MVIANTSISIPTSKPSSEAQRAAEAEGRDLDVAIAGECRRITNTKPMAVEVGNIQHPLMPPTPIAVVQWLDGNKWFDTLIFTASMLAATEKHRASKPNPYRITMLHFECGEAREAREREEARWKADLAELNAE